MLNRINIINNNNINIYLQNKECQNTMDKLKNEIKENINSYKQK